MTKWEFLKRVKEENISLPNRTIAVDCGLISTKNDKFVLGCTQVTKGSSYFIYDSDYVSTEKEIPEQEFLEVKDNKGKNRKVPIPLGIFIYQSFESEEKAFDKFYEMIKEDMAKKKGISKNCNF